MEQPRHLKMTVKVAGTTYSINLPYNGSQDNAELVVREAAEQVNALVKRLETAHGVSEKKDLLAMASLELAKVMRANQDVIQESLTRLTTLEELLDDELKNNNY